MYSKIFLLIVCCVSVAYSEYNNNNYQYDVNENNYQYPVEGAAKEYIQKNSEEYVPVIENGVPVDTPEVQQARAEHFRLYAKAAAETEKANQKDKFRQQYNYYNNNIGDYSDSRSYEAPASNEYYYQNNGLPDQYLQTSQGVSPVEASHLTGHREAFGLVQGQGQSKADQGQFRSY